MRVLIDLQAAQSTGSANRGIGRYALNLTRSLLAAKREEWEMHILINGAFRETAAELAWEFGSKLGAERVHVMWSVEASKAVDATGRLRRTVSRSIRKAAIAAARPDVVLLTSLFEGYDDDAFVETERPHRDALVVGIVYDLIPLLFPMLYLQNHTARVWYYGVVQQVRKLDLVLAISEATRQDLIASACLRPNAVVTVHGAACLPAGEPVRIDPAGIGEVLKRFQLSERYILYTGGNEQRKNIPFLIKAFLLAKSVPFSVQLVIVCRIDASSIDNLLAEAGLTERSDRVVFTDYVSDDDLTRLYKHCWLFVFPSWYEGLGLPVLEAAAYGAPIIASASSSMVEILNMSEATFDPYDVVDCATQISRGVSDPEFRARLLANSKRIAESYSWERTAAATAAAIEAAVASQTPARTVESLPRPTVANVTPLSPAQSGIALYAHDAIPAMAQFGDVTSFSDQAVVTDIDVMLHSEVAPIAEFERRWAEFDLIVYHIGNSHFHWHDLHRLQCAPGVVVLHDPFLSGMVTDACNKMNDLLGLFRAHDAAHGPGVAAAQMQQPFKHAGAASRLLLSFWAVAPATTVLVHSAYAKALLTAQYGVAIGEKIEVINFPLRLPPPVNKASVKRSTGVLPDDLVVCSFGFVAPIKGSEDIVDGWIRVSRRLGVSIRLILVGRAASEQFAHRLQERAKRAGLADAFLITGFVDQAAYERYLGAADIAIQLRRSARGESSMAVAECLVRGIPTIVNENGSLAELPRDAVCMLPDHFEATELANALQHLVENEAERLSLSLRARSYAETQFDPRRYAEQLTTLATRCQNSSAYWRASIVREISRLHQPKLNAFDRQVLFDPIVLTFPPENSRPRLFFDVSGMRNSSTMRQIFRVVRDKDTGDRLLDLVDVSQDRFMVDSATISELFETSLPFRATIPRSLTAQDTVVLGLRSAIAGATNKWLQNFALTGGRTFLVVGPEDISACISDVDFRLLIDFALTYRIGLLTSARWLAALQDRLDQHIQIKGQMTAHSFDDPSFADEVGRVLLHGRPSGTEHRLELGRRRLFPASDPRLRVGVGHRIGPMIVAAGQAGHMLYGPYIDLPPSTYEVEINLQVEHAGPTRLEVVGVDLQGQPVLFDVGALPNNSTGHRVLSARIDVTSVLRDVEVRFFVAAEVRVAALSLSFTSISRDGSRHLS